jgi:malate dehydrogenase (oxaloacetate-decarboxylating)
MMAEGLSEKEARKRFFLIDRDGLLVEGIGGILPFQEKFVQPRSAVADWRLESPDRIGLIDVARNARPSVLIGVSGQPGAFSQDVVRTIAGAVDRPIIFPLSNPTSRSEATPQDLLAWTEQRAIIGTGSPFPPVSIRGRSRSVDQTNNAYVFPGIGLGALAVRARRISEDMFMAAARAVADASPARSDRSASLLPPVDELRQVSRRVAVAVAVQAQTEGLAEDVAREQIEARVNRKIWWPVYRPYRRLPR